MAIDPNLLSLMIESVTLQPYTGQDAYGVPTYGTGVSYAARVSLKNELVRAHDGREIASRGKVYVAMDTVPDVRSKLTLPSGYQPTQPPILDVQPEQDELGLNHVVLVMG